MALATGPSLFFFEVITLNKIFNLAVKSRSYKDKNGNDKAVWKSVGSLMEHDGNKFIMLDASFNPAGVPRKDGSDCINIYLFTPKDNKDNHNKSSSYGAWLGGNAKNPPNSFDSFDNEQSFF